MASEDQHCNGLTTREALLKLTTEIEQMLWQFEKSRKSRQVSFIVVDIYYKIHSGLFIYL